jgi:C1A family cysteine protease
MWGRRRGLGWIPNKEDRRDFDISLLGIETTETFPAECSLRQFQTKILNQGRTNSCVANALAHALLLRENQKRHTQSSISRLFVYYNARRFYGGHRSDSGTFIRTAIKGMSKFGAPDEAYWDFSTLPWNVNRRPGWEAYMHAFSRREGLYYTIQDEGLGRVVAIQTALRAGYPVVFGTLIDGGFLKNEGDYYLRTPPRLPNTLGGHAMCIRGFKYIDGVVWFDVVNSWGMSWRNGGCAWLSENWIKWPWASDFTVLAGWEKTS